MLYQAIASYRFLIDGEYKYVMVVSEWMESKVEAIRSLTHQVVKELATALDVQVLFMELESKTPVTQLGVTVQDIKAFKESRKQIEAEIQTKLKSQKKRT